MRTTITIPDSLAEQVDRLVTTGITKSRNQFIVEALEAKVREIKDIQLDAEFASMANDPDYQQETLSIEQEFALSDAEVLKLTEE